MEKAATQKALHIALISQWPKVANLLMEFGADTNIQNKDKRNNILHVNAKVVLSCTATSGKDRK